MDAEEVGGRTKNSCVCDAASRHVTISWSTSLLIEPLVVHKLPNAVHPGIAACSRGGLILEAVTTSGKGVEIRLDAHPAQLFPAFDRAHRRMAVRISVNEEHRASIKFNTPSGGGVGFDSIIVSIPEPSSTALLGLGGLALIMRRKRS